MDLDFYRIGATIFFGFVAVGVAIAMFVMFVRKDRKS